MLKQLISDSGFLTDEQVRGFVSECAASLPVYAKRVLFVVPDNTRSMPMPLVFRALVAALRGRAKAINFLIALGTHPPMSDTAIEKHFGLSRAERENDYGDVVIFNHAWQNPDALVEIGTVTREEVSEISGGLLEEAARVTINRQVLEHDLVCVVGPVFPHEVVGFSGGNKYFFPGVSGEEILNLFHWLGALITNYKINGTKHTPVRAVVNRAAAMIPVERYCFCFTVVRKDTRAVFFGTPETAWEAAADLSAKTHIVFKDRPFKSVLAIAPEMYDEIWVAGKCMYKLEPVIADGGELIIYGPHIKEVSITHGALIKRIGYHVRDYFTKQPEKFRDVPGGILAHSTHVRGMGTFEDGVERPRVKVTLATSIPEQECRAINLGYRDYREIDLAQWEGQEEAGRLLVPNAGEILYRLHDE